jgi:hypothetical protein
MFDNNPLGLPILPHLRRQMPYRIVHHSVFALRATPRQERNSIFLVATATLTTAQLSFCFFIFSNLKFDVGRWMFDVHSVFSIKTI